MDVDLQTMFVERPRHDIIRKLFEIELDHMAADGYSHLETISSLRRAAIAIIRKYSRTNEDAFTPLLALTYFDRCVSRRPLQNGQQFLKFFAICCLVLASKLRSKHFELLQFLNEHNLDDIDAEEIMGMELQILSALNWRMRSVTAFSFLDYFICSVNVNDQPSKQALKHRVMTNFVYGMYTKISFTRFRPSIIAASAVLADYISSGKYHMFKEIIASNPYVDREQLLDCVKDIRTKLFPQRFQSPLGQRRRTPFDLPSASSDDETKDSTSVAMSDDSVNMDVSAASTIEKLMLGQECSSSKKRCREEYDDYDYDYDGGIQDYDAAEDDGGGDDGGGDYDDEDEEM